METLPLKVMPSLYPFTMPSSTDFPGRPFIYQRLWHLTAFLSALPIYHDHGRLPRPHTESLPPVTILRPLQQSTPMFLTHTLSSTGPAPPSKYYIPKTYFLFHQFFDLSQISSLSAIPYSYKMCAPLWLHSLSSLSKTPRDLNFDQWKQPRCPSVGKPIKKLWYIQTTD